MMNETKFSPTDFCNRLATIGSNETTEGLKTDGDRPIVVLASARDWKFVRIVMHHEINDADVALVIKKIVYVIKEFDASTAAA